MAIKSPYIQVYGIQLDPDANGAAIRSFSSQEEEEFLAIARRPNFYNEFIGSLAPQIYGSDGEIATFFSHFAAFDSYSTFLAFSCRYQKGNRLPLVWWIKKVPARRNAFERGCQCPHAW